MIQYNKADIIEYLETYQGKTYTMLGYTLIAVIISLIFAIKPGIESILSEKVQIDQNTVTSATLTQNIADVNKLNASYNKYILPNLDLIYFALPPEQGYASLFANVQGLATQDNLTFEGMTYTLAPAQNTDPTELEVAPANSTSLYVTISVKGAQTQLVKFLTDLENYPRPLNIYSANLQTEITNSNQNATLAPTFDGNYTLNANVQTFYRVN